MTQYKVLWTNIVRVVWLTVRRIINLIWELKGYLRSNPYIDVIIKKIWLYCGAHKHFKQLNLLSACDVVSGKKVDYLTLNPLVLGTISGTGLLLKSTMESKIISKKSSHHCVCRLEKILVDLRSFVRGKPYDDQNYLTQLRVLEDIVIDMCPLFNNWDKEYSQKFISE